jgi:hypothetical protein
MHVGPGEQGMRFTVGVEPIRVTGAMFCPVDGLG